MSKKHQNITKPQGKKQIDEEAMAFLKNEQPQQPPSTSKRRLRKLGEVNHSEKLVSGDHDDHSERLSEQQKDQYVQFHVQDDEDIKRQKQQEEAAKQAKKLKGNQKIDTFISKQAKQQKKTSKNKPLPKNQLTLEELNSMKKQKKKNKKYSDQEFLNDDSDISNEDQERQAQRKRKEASKKYKEFNGTNQTEQQLIQKAMKLSLTATSDKFGSFEDYHINNDEINKKLQLPKKSVKKQEEEKLVTKPSAAKKADKKSKEVKDVNTGPFSDLVIAFTGAYDQYDKDQVIEVCQQLGAVCPKSLTKKCNLLFQGAFVLDTYGRRLKTPITQTSKSKEAAERGITIIPYDQLDQYFINKTGFSLAHHLDKNKVIAKNHLSSFMNKKVQSDNEFESLKIEDNPMKIEEANKNDNLNQFAYYKEDNVKQNVKHENVQQKMDIEKPIQHPTITDNRLWTQKYKPHRLDDVIGQQNQIKQLKQWLQAWQDIHINGNKRQVKQTKGGWGGGGNINSKAALLSGDPGIGKTTTARLLAAQFNYLVSEFNASDIRNKSSVALLQSGSYNIDAAKNLQKSLIIMDEVDGMSSGDRGGVASIIQMIKNSKIPIICVCNDRSSQKIRSLANHCLDIKFHKPNKNLVARRLKQIIAKEGGVGEDRALQQLTQSYQNDMRQILNYLEIIFKTVSKKITVDALSNRNKHAKDSSVMINHFDATRRLLVRPEFDGLRVQQRVQCFFVQSDLVPLMVHQNILSSASKRPLDGQKMHRFVQGISGFVLGDMLDRTIRKQQQWGLMPSYGFMTCVYTTEKISEAIGYPSFPSWFGKNSTEKKNKRLARQLKNDFYPVTLCSSWKAIKQHYSPLLLQELIQLLKRESVEEAVMLMEQYKLTPATLNQHLISMQFILDKSNPLAVVPTATKSKLTRLFNKRHEESKLKQTKAVKGKNQHIKFNPVLEIAEDQYEEVEQEPAEEKQPEIKAKAKAPKKK